MIDLRSDTVTKPTRAMRDAMAGAEVGDDVFGEDPSVNRLEEAVASLLGKEKALFVPSGTMGNQICIKVHTQPGDEVIAEKECHVFNYETGAIAFLSSVQVNTIIGDHGVFTALEVKKLIRPHAYYMPRTKLICLENTHNRGGGTIFPHNVIKEMGELAHDRSIGLHLDGARLWNACAVTGISPATYASHVDSISVCFSKGLGAPVGSAIAGTKDFIDEARHYRKIFGGGMRQAGVLAAGALYALEHNRDRLREDHEKARWLAGELAQNRLLDVEPDTVQTNIVLVGIEKTGKDPSELLAALRMQGILLTPGTYMSLRAVTHMDVSMDDVQNAGRTINKVIY